MFVRFIVNITGTFVDCFKEYFIYQLDHAGFLGHFEQVIRTLSNIDGLHGLIIHQRIDGVAAQPVVGLDRSIDLLLRSEVRFPDR